MSERKESTKMSRREFARKAAAGSAVAAAAPALLVAPAEGQETKAPQKAATPTPSPRRRSIEIVEQFPVPVETEPDFVFRP
ncbi:MAG TPA: hypothetical protein VN661_08470 [Candidatus Acidoferrales bacterium]|nr:hypothetical protein [Candidatus Acidoferrales bacterium]